MQTVCEVYTRKLVMMRTRQRVCRGGGPWWMMAGREGLLEASATRMSTLEFGGSRNGNSDPHIPVTQSRSVTLEPTTPSQSKVRLIKVHSFLAWPTCPWLSVGVPHLRSCFPSLVCPIPSRCLSTESTSLKADHQLKSDITLRCRCSGSSSWNTGSLNSPRFRSTLRGNSLNLVHSLHSHVSSSSDIAWGNPHLQYFIRPTNQLVIPAHLDHDENIEEHLHSRSSLVLSC
jgi:hypothetical protein